MSLQFSSASHAAVAAPAPSAATIERLERRRLLSVSLDAAGYTLVTPGKDDRVIYVSSSAGSDSADGLSPTRPVQSLERGAALLRDGRGDQLLLMRGDTWQGALPGWRKSGASADRPMVIGAYGTGDRPTIATSGYNGFFTAAGGVSHLVLQGLRIVAPVRDPDSGSFDAGTAGRIGIGLSIVSGGSNLLIEDCYVANFSTNVAIQNGAATNVRLRRNVIVDAYARGSHSQGLFVDRVRGLLLEENVFDHNGWSEKANVRATIFNHNAYITVDVTDVVVTGNVFANAASHGLQARSGGDILDNLFVANPLHLSYGLVRGDGSPAGGGVGGIVNGNVLLGTRDIDGQVRGIGIEVANIRSSAGGPTLISNNIFSNVAGNGVPWQRGGFAAIALEVGSGKNDAELAVGINNLTIQGNIVRGWAKGISMTRGMTPGIGGTWGYRNLSVKRNEFSQIDGGPIVEHPAEFDGSQERWSGNWYSGDGGIRVAGRSQSPDKWAGGGDRSGTPGYADGGRSLQAYMASAGGGDAASFLHRLRAMANPAGASSVAATPTTAAAAINFVRDGYESPAPGAERRNWKPPTPPTAEAALPASVTTDETGFTFTVTYRDDAELNLATIDGDEVQVTAKGRSLNVELLSVDPANAQTATAVYRVSSPAAVWRPQDRGSFKVKAIEGTVRDADGFAVEPGTVAAADVDVIQLPAPPTVKKLKFVKGKKDQPDQVVVKLSTELSALPSPADLTLSPVSPPAVGDLPLEPLPPVDLSAATVTYDADRRQLIWTFPAYPQGQLPAGTYDANLRADTLQSIDAKPLDGNKDGLPGDGYARPKPIRVKR